MGRFERLRPPNLRVHESATPPESEAEVDHDPDDHHRPDRPAHPAMVRPVHLLFAIGIDGQGPLSSAVELADAARSSSPSTEEAVARVARTAIVRGAAGGFVTGLAGYPALRVAVPLNVVEFYVQAARVVSAIAILRGHDIDDAGARKAVLQTLVGHQHDSVLAKAISATPGSSVIWRLLHLLPAGLLLVAGKALAFRLLRGMAERLFGRFGRGLPFIGGVLVAATDAAMMRRIAARAMVDFPEVPDGPQGDLGPSV